jgi:hypothetical protein
MPFPDDGLLAGRGAPGAAAAVDSAVHPRPRLAVLPPHDAEEVPGAVVARVLEPRRQRVGVRVVDVRHADGAVKEDGGLAVGDPGVEVAADELLRRRVEAVARRQARTMRRLLLHRRSCESCLSWSETKACSSVAAEFGLGGRHLECLCVVVTDTHTGRIVFVDRLLDLAGSYPSPN